MCRLLQPHLRICQIEAQVPSGAVLFGSIGACHPFRYYLAPVPLQRPVRLSVGRSTAGVFRVLPIQAHSLRQPRSDGGTQNALATAFPIPAGHPLSRVGNACARALNMSQSAGMLTVPIISGFCGRGGMWCGGRSSQPRKNAPHKAGHVAQGSYYEATPRARLQPHHKTGCQNDGQQKGHCQPSGARNCTPRSAPKASISSCSSHISALVIFDVD